VSSEVFKAAVGIERAGLLRAAALVCEDCANGCLVRRGRKLMRFWFHDAYSSDCAASRIHSLLSDDPILGDGRTER
jgi:hypothetical protein